MSIKFDIDERIAMMLINNCSDCFVFEDKNLYNWQFVKKLNDDNINSAEFIEFICENYKSIYESMIKLVRSKIINHSIPCHSVTYHNELCILRLKEVLDILQMALPDGYSVGEILGKFIITSPNDYSSLIESCAEDIPNILKKDEELKDFLNNF